MKKTSKIWTTTKSELQQIVRQSRSRSEVLRKLGLSTNGASNHNRLKMRFWQDNIDCSNFCPTNAGICIKTRIPLEDILVENSTYQNRSRLIKEGYLENKCRICDLTEWFGEPISLQLHHKNGVHNDHRLSNIDLLCPNCHTQTDTYSGKNK